MSGISILLDTSPVQRLLGQLVDKLEDMTPVMQDIGEIIVFQADEAFEREESPAGVPWEPSARALAGGKTLHGDTGILRNSFGVDAIAASAHRVVVGTNVPYAAIHQLGGRTKPHVIRPRTKKALAFGGIVVRSVNHPGSLMPSRPFLPDDQSVDWSEITATLMEYLS